MIRLIILDIDGCMTDGKIIYTENGDEIKAFNVKDGLAIKSWQRLGHHVAIITGRKSDIVRRRAQELGIEHLYQGIKDKAAKVDELMEKLSIAPREIAAIGDDLNDYGMLEMAGYSFVPANASHYVKSIADTVLENPGGEGAVREMIESVVRINDQEEAFLAQWV